MSSSAKNILPTATARTSQQVSPLISKVQLSRPTASAGRSQGAVAEQNITYNQAGIRYNEPGITYGGFYGYADIKPLVSLAKSIIPSIVRGDDIYTQAPAPGAGGASIGPGFFMFITH